MTIIKHQAALYCGGPKHRYRWHAAIIIEDPKGRTVLWQSETIYPNPEAAQEAAKAHAEATTT